MSRGLLVTFEGPEASGKSTQVDLLRPRLDALYLREPGSTPLGERIRELLLHGPAMHPQTEAYLFLAARAEMVMSLVIPALQRGQTVVVDRYHDSTIAYQGARGVEVGWPPWLPRPDLTVLLDVPPEVAARRLARPRDRIEAMSDEFHERVRQGYLEMARREPDRFLVLDATGAAQHLAQAVWQRLGRLKPLLARTPPAGP